MFQKTVVDPQFTEAIDAFLIDDKARRLSPRTLESYAFQLNRFVSWCAETRRTTRLSDIDAHTLRTYLAEQHDKGLSPWTVHGSARVLRTFGRWCAAEVLVTAKLASIPAPTASPSRLTSAFCASDSAAVNTAFALTLRRSVVMLPSGVVLLGLVSVSSPLPYQQNSPPFNFNQTRYIPLRGEIVSLGFYATLESWPNNAPGLTLYTRVGFSAPAPVLTVESARRGRRSAVEGAMHSIS